MTTKLEDQIAEAEAPDAEPGDEEGAEPSPDAEPDADEEGDAEEPAEEGPAEEPLEPSAQAVIKQLEGERTRRHKALQRIMGDNFEGYEECPVCLAMGYTPGTPFKQDTAVTKCETCAGFGVVLTGAVNPETMTRQCPSCIGNGYVPTGETLPPAYVAQPFNGDKTGMASPVNPEIEKLRAAGYTVLEPFVPTATLTP